MCDECRRKSREDQPGGETAGNVGLSRRMLLAMGTSVAAGVALGLGKCQNPTFERGAANSGSGSKSGTRTDSGSALIPTTIAPISGSATASSQTASSQTSQGAPQAASRPPAPDLGAEVFPDATGKAIAQPGDAPVIIVPRTDWTTARPNLSQIQVMNGVNRITVHHTAGQIQTDAWTPTAGALEGIREFHVGTAPTDRNWADIAYHFAIDRAGRVWQARPLAYQGAHARGHNAHNLGIVLLGNFAVQSPAAAQLMSLSLFIRFVRTLYAVPLDLVYTHGELVDTQCPGRLLQEYMDRGRQAWGRAEGAPWRKVTTFPASDPAAASHASEVSSRAEA